MVIAELRAVAFVEDEDYSLVAQGLEALLVVALVGAVERQAELLNRGNNDLVGGIVGEEPAD